MKKLNFFPKLFSLLLVLMVSAHFGELKAQSFISEDQAMLKLSTKLEQLSKVPNSSISFPDGTKVTGDINTNIRTRYYSMILQNLETKDQAGNHVSTKVAYEATKAFFNQKPQNNAPTPKTTEVVGITWLHNEALQYLTH